VLTDCGPTRGERGSVVLATSAIALVGLVLTIVVSVSMTNSRRTRADTDRKAALAVTEIALAEISARVDLGETATFRGVAVVGSSTVRYQATRTSATRWDASISGSQGSQVRFVTAQWNSVGLTWTRSAAAELSPTYAQTVRSLAPSSYWRLGEDGGAVVADSGAAAIGGSIFGVTTLNVTGALSRDDDGALTFGSPAGWVSFGDVYDFVGTSAFTVGGFVRLNDAATNYQTLFRKYDPSAYPTISGWTAILGTAPLTTEIARWNGSGWGFVDYLTGSGPVVGQWRHVVMTYDGAEFRLYLDGRLDQRMATTRALPDTTVPMTLSQPVGWNAPLQGTLDEIAVWDRALTEVEIRELVAAR
jgi:type II secretory pathway pseudopilin PulG